MYSLWCGDALDWNVTLRKWSFLIGHLLLELSLQLLLSLGFAAIFGWSWRGLYTQNMQHLLPAHKFTRVQTPRCPHVEASDASRAFISTFVVIVFFLLTNVDVADQKAAQSGTDYSWQKVWLRLGDHNWKKMYHNKRFNFSLSSFLMTYYEKKTRTTKALEFTTFLLTF